MNRHLNVFHTYTKVNREQQLENDLTRALAICLQEDKVFLNTILKFILDKNSYDALFNDISSESKIAIEIQRNVETLEAFNKLFAISISGFEMQTSLFSKQSKSSEVKEYITDLILLANDIAIIAEVKPNNSDCTYQLAQQAHKAIESNEIQFDAVVPIDLSWKKLMAIAVQVSNFNRVSGITSRFLSDFIQYIRQHNHNWLPVASFSSLENSITKKSAYIQRLKAALSIISENHPSLDYGNRFGLKLDVPWAQEIVINIDEYKHSQAAISFDIWPGNTKGQGSRMHQLIANRPWQPPKSLNIQGNVFEVKTSYELKFCHFNAYVSNLVITDAQVKPGKQILSLATHHEYTGKYEREYWGNLEKFLDDYLVDDFDWREHLGWNTNFLNTGRTYLTLSIGYQIETAVPVTYLQQIDTSQDDLTKLTDLIIQIKQQYEKLFD